MNEPESPRPTPKATIAIAAIAIIAAGYAFWQGWNEKARIERAREDYRNVTQELAGYSEAFADHQKQLKSVVSGLDALRQASASARTELDQTNKRIAELAGRIEALSKP